MATGCTKEQAESLCSKISDLLRSHHKTLRVKLGEAFLWKPHEALGLNSFEDFLEKCKSEGVEFSNSYMRRVAQAAAFEIKKNGISTVGQIREGSLRPLFENVAEEHRDAVYEHAIKLAKAKKNKRNLTANHIVKAAKELEYYKQQESKTKSNRGFKLARAVIKARKGTTKRGGDSFLINKATKKDVPCIVGNTVDEVKNHSRSPEKTMRILANKYDDNKLKSIRDFLRLYQKRKLKSVCEKLVAENDESSLKKLVELLTCHISVSNIDV